MVKPLVNALSVWYDPVDMLTMWGSSSWKAKLECIVADFVMTRQMPISVVELGCGNGRHAQLLNFAKYTGFDMSLPMLEEARKLNKTNPNAEFSLIDVFRFTPTIAYDALLMIDVAHHQDNPVEAVAIVLNNWKAGYYYISLLVGQDHQDLYNSTIINFDEWLTIIDNFNVVRYHIERFEKNNFAWVLMEIKCYQ